MKHHNSWSPSRWVSYLLDKQSKPLKDVQRARGSVLSTQSSLHIPSPRGEPSPPAEKTNFMLFSTFLFFWPLPKAFHHRWGLERWPTGKTRAFPSGSAPFLLQQSSQLMKQDSISNSFMNTTPRYLNYFTWGSDSLPTWGQQSTACWQTTMASHSERLTFVPAASQLVEKWPTAC